MSHRRTVASFAAVLSLLPLVSAWAQETTRSQNDPRPMAHAAARSGGVVVDGNLDEAAWAAATPITEFVQQTPDEGRPPTQRTEVRVLYDQSAIYVGARMFDDEGASGVRAVLTRRDQLLNAGALTSDKLALIFDTYRDKNTQTWFELNPLGVKGDDQNHDESYDPVWDGASRVDSLGWTAEFRIPFSQLRFTRDTAQSWGMQIWRMSDRTHEQDMWAFWRQNESGGPAYFGTLDGMMVSTRPRQIEIVPYMTSRSTLARAAVGDPYHSDRESVYRVGGDLRVNLTSNLTLDATVYPDFGQVEVDPAVVNLSVFETTFGEKRPFFISNSQYFQFDNFNCAYCNNASSLSPVYTRRIGRSPQLAGLVGSRSAFMDAPDATTILGAAKVTGRTKNGISVGLLDAVTDRETAVFRAPASSVDQTEEIEPLANYFVGRVLKDLRAGNTRVGGILTLVNRGMRNDDERARLRSNAQTIGFDLDHYWRSRSYSLAVQTALTSIAGDTGAIRRAQESSARYYQRPGRTESSDGLFSTSYDPTRRTLRGYGIYVRLAKETGNWRWETLQNWRSAGYETNDMGVLGNSDYKWMLANATRVWTTPGRFYRSARWTVGAQHQLNYQNDRTDLDYHTSASMTFNNYTNVGVSLQTRPSFYEDRLTRGGPTVIRYGYDFYSINAGTDGRKPVVGDVSIQYSTPNDNDEGGRIAFYPSVTLKPSPRVLVSVSPWYDHDWTAQQFVGSDTATFVPAGFNNMRYVFGRLEQKTAAVDIRVNTTFTPTLTLELFAEPFLASGKYTSFKEFAEVRSRHMLYYGRDNGSTIVENHDLLSGDLVGYTVDADGGGPAPAFDIGNPNFNIRSLRGTGVLRWEFRPGSTLFFVWTQERSGFDSFGDFDFSRDRAALFRDRPTNVFQIKATYWIGR